MLKEVYIPNLLHIARLVSNLYTENGYLLSIEWPIYVLDALPMAVVMAVCVMWHVGRFEDISNVEVELNLRAVSNGGVGVSNQ